MPRRDLPKIEAMTASDPGFRGCMTVYEGTREQLISAGLATSSMFTASVREGRYPGGSAIDMWYLFPLGLGDLWGLMYYHEDLSREPNPYLCQE